MAPSSPHCMSERCLVICQVYGEADPYRWFLQLTSAPSWVLSWHRIRTLDLKYRFTLNKTSPRTWEFVWAELQSSGNWRYKVSPAPPDIHIPSEIFNDSPFFMFLLCFILHPVLINEAPFPVICPECGYSYWYCPSKASETKDQKARCLPLSWFSNSGHKHRACVSCENVCHWARPPTQMQYLIILQYQSVATRWILRILEVCTVYSLPAMSGKLLASMTLVFGFFFFSVTNA